MHMSAVVVVQDPLLYESASSPPIGIPHSATCGLDLQAALWISLGVRNKSLHAAAEAGASQAVATKDFLLLLLWCYRSPSWLAWALTAPGAALLGPPAQ